MKATKKRIFNIALVFLLVLQIQMIFTATSTSYNNVNFASMASIYPSQYTLPEDLKDSIALASGNLSGSRFYTIYLKDDNDLFIYQNNYYIDKPIYTRFYTDSLTTTVSKSLQTCNIDQEYIVISYVIYNSGSNKYIAQLKIFKFDGDDWVLRGDKELFSDTNIISYPKCEQIYATPTNDDNIDHIAVTFYLTDGANKGIQYFKTQYDHIKTDVHTTGTIQILQSKTPLLIIYNQYYDFLVYNGGLVFTYISDFSQAGNENNLAVYFKLYDLDGTSIGTQYLIPSSQSKTDGDFANTNLMLALKQTEINGNYGYEFTVAFLQSSKTLYIWFIDSSYTPLCYINYQSTNTLFTVQNLDYVIIETDMYINFNQQRSLSLTDIRYRYENTHYKNIDLSQITFTTYGDMCGDYQSSSDPNSIKHTSQNSDSSSTIIQNLGSFAISQGNNSCVQLLGYMQTSTTSGKITLTQKNYISYAEKSSDSLFEDNCEYGCLDGSANFLCEVCIDFDDSVQKTLRDIDNNCYCISGYYETSANICEECGYQCSLCDVNGCDGCISTLRDDDIYCNCMTQHYEIQVFDATETAIDGECHECPEQCDECTYDYDQEEVNCVACQYTAGRDPANLCACLTGYTDFQDVGKDCHLCDGGTVNAANECVCPDGQYSEFDAGTQKYNCIDCLDYCDKCVDGLTCLECESEELDEDGDTVCSCINPIFTYEPSIKQCQCPDPDNTVLSQCTCQIENCLDCPVSNVVCVDCAENFELDADTSQCYCPESLTSSTIETCYQDNGKVFSEDNCTCIEQIISDSQCLMYCTSCQSGECLKCSLDSQDPKNNCICPLGSYWDSATDKCTQCDSTCETCTDGKSCDSNIIDNGQNNNDKDGGSSIAVYAAIAGVALLLLLLCLLCVYCIRKKKKEKEKKIFSTQKNQQNLSQEASQDDINLDPSKQKRALAASGAAATVGKDGEMDDDTRNMIIKANKELQKYHDDLKKQEELDEEEENYYQDDTAYKQSYDQLQTVKKESESGQKLINKPYNDGSMAKKIKDTGTAKRTNWNQDGSQLDISDNNLLSTQNNENTKFLSASKFRNQNENDKTFLDLSDIENKNAALSLAEKKNLLLTQKKQSQQNDLQKFQQNQKNLNQNNQQQQSGNLIKEKYAGFDENGNQVEGGSFDENGNYIVHTGSKPAGFDKNKRFDERGLYDKTGKYLGLNIDGQPGGYNKEGDVDPQGQYDDAGNYVGPDKPVEKGEFDNNGKRMTNGKGNFDETGLFVVHTGGKNGGYDKSGRKTENGLYDKNGKYKGQNMAGVQGGFDSQGNPDPEGLYDDQQNYVGPVKAVKSGGYDKNGRKTTNGPFDQNGNYVVHTAGKVAGYDKNGNKAEDGLYDNQGNYLGVNINRIPGGFNKYGQTDQLGTYDDQGNNLLVQMPGKGGYDRKGNFQKNGHFDSKGQYVVHTGGREGGFNSQGLKDKNGLYDKNGNYQGLNIKGEQGGFNKNGKTDALGEFDDQGNYVGINIFGEGGYDAQGNQTLGGHFDKNGKYIVNTGGIEAKHNVNGNPDPKGLYDAKGNYLGLNIKGQPGGFDKDGNTDPLGEFDDQGKSVAISLAGIGGYDRLGKKQKEGFYDRNGKYVVHTGGRNAGFDENGNKVKNGLYDNKGNYKGLNVKGQPGGFDKDGNTDPYGGYDDKGNFRGYIEVIKGGYDAQGNLQDGGSYDKDGNYIVHTLGKKTGFDSQGKRQPNGLYDKNGNYQGVNLKGLPGGFTKSGKPDALGSYDDKGNYVGLNINGVKGGYDAMGKPDPYGLHGPDGQYLGQDKEDYERQKLYDKDGIYKGLNKNGVPGGYDKHGNKDDYGLYGPYGEFVGLNKFDRPGGYNQKGQEDQEGMYGPTPESYYVGLNKLGKRGGFNRFGKPDPLGYHCPDGLYVGLNKNGKLGGFDKNGKTDVNGVYGPNGEDYTSEQNNNFFLQINKPRKTNTGGHSNEEYYIQSQKIWTYQHNRKNRNFNKNNKVWNQSDRKLEEKAKKDLSQPAFAFIPPKPKANSQTSQITELISQNENPQSQKGTLDASASDVKNQRKARKDARKNKRQQMQEKSHEQDFLSSNPSHQDQEPLNNTNNNKGNYFEQFQNTQSISAIAADSNGFNQKKNGRAQNADLLNDDDDNNVDLTNNDDDDDDQELQKLREKKKQQQEEMKMINDLDFI